MIHFQHALVAHLAVVRSHALYFPTFLAVPQATEFLLKVWIVIQLILDGVWDSGRR